MASMDTSRVNDSLGFSPYTPSTVGDASLSWLAPQRDERDEQGRREPMPFGFDDPHHDYRDLR